MTTVHEFGELDSKGVVLQLTPAERRALARLEGRLGVEWHADGSARVYARGNVGIARLSPDTVISVTTKVPVANVLTLASLAYQTLALPPAVGEAALDRVDNVVDWLALLLVSEIQSLLAQGLRQDYVVIEDELPYIRGRLRFDATLASPRRGLTACEFADFLPDIPENRILRAALELLATQRLLPGLRARVEQLLASFQRVSYIRATDQLLRSCRVTRLNRHYEPALELCRLLLDQAGATLTAGGLAAPAYFFPMEMVFQEGVTTLLRTRLPGVSRQAGRTYQPVAGAPPRSLTFAADIVVGVPPRLVIDTKYAAPETPNRYGGTSFRNEHVYQVAFYALSLDCPGVLVYPRVDYDVDVTFDIEGIPVSLLTVDLDKAGLAGLEGLAARLEAMLAATEGA